VGFWTLLALIATLTLIVLVGRCVAEHWVNSASDTLRQPMSVNELVREWIICVVLFGGLSALLHGALRLACWTVC
jgi:short subunit fatty acids transporter